MKHSAFRATLASLVAAGCRSLPEPTPVAEPAASVVASSKEPDAGVPAAVVAPPSTPPSLSVVYQGDCSTPTRGHLGAKPAFTLGQSAFVVEPTGTRRFHTDHAPPSPYGTFASSFLGRVGGIDEAHAWLERRSPSRGEGTDGKTLFAGTGWKESGFTSSIEDYREQPDGSLWAIGVQELSEGPRVAKYYAWDPSGVPQQAHLPGGDMEGALRLQSGELVVGARSKTNRVVVRRWSPSKAVTDLVVAGSPVSESAVQTRVGTTHAVVVTYEKQRPFFTWYDGTALRDSKLDLAGLAITSWMLSADDTLFVGTRSGELLIEHADGVLEREKLPAPGLLAEATRARWLLATSGAVYMRTAKAWIEIAVPEGPWSGPDHGPRRIEYIEDAGSETLVSAVQTESQGFGRSKPGAVRTMYSTGRQVPLRCGAPFESGVIAALPPAADAVCKTPIVLVSREAAKLPAGYPKIAAAVKGKSTLGTSLDVISFGAEPARLVGVRVPSLEVGQAVAAALRAAKLAPELLCGADPVTRTLHLDVQTGAFSQ